MRHLFILVALFTANCVFADDEKDWFAFEMVKGSTLTTNKDLEVLTQLGMFVVFTNHNTIKLTPDVTCYFVTKEPPRRVILKSGYKFVVYNTLIDRNRRTLTWVLNENPVFDSLVCEGDIYLDGRVMRNFFSRSFDMNVVREVVTLEPEASSDFDEFQSTRFR